MTNWVFTLGDDDLHNISQDFGELWWRITLLDLEIYQVHLIVA